MLALILFTVGEGSKEIFQDEGLNFLTNTDWNAVPGRESFGALPYIIGTLVCSGIAMAIGVPISLGIAIFLSRSEEHTSELQSQSNLVCRLLLEKKKQTVIVPPAAHLHGSRPDVPPALPCHAGGGFLELIVCERPSTPPLSHQEPGATLAPRSET